MEPTDQQETEQAEQPEQPSIEQTEKENEAAREEMKELEKADELPTNPSEWPGGKAKFLTFAHDSDEPYGEGPTEKLGPSLAHHDDGSVSIDGEKVDNPDDYKGEPIPGGPTDPNAPKLAGEEDRSGNSEDKD